MCPILNKKGVVLSRRLAGRPSSSVPHKALQLCTDMAMKNIYDLKRLCKIVHQIWKSAGFTSSAFKSKNFAKILENTDINLCVHAF